MSREQLSQWIAANTVTPPDQVKARQGNKQHEGNCNKVYGVCQLQHKMLDYVTARYVMGVLDQLGEENWQTAIQMEGEKVARGIGILIDDLWVWKWDGAGETDIEGEKGSFSDALKRAGVLWGIARDLYGDDRKAAAPPRARARASTPPPTDPQALAQQVFGEDEIVDHSVCPFHDKPWRLGNPKYGYYCSAKSVEGDGSTPNAKGYCTAKPPEWWAPGT